MVSRERVVSQPLDSNQLLEDEQGWETRLPAWLLARMLSHSNCRARALYSHFLSPTQELGNLDLKIVTRV